jgi:hypothetical protein
VVGVIVISCLFFARFALSAYLASRLKELVREGELDLSWDKAEGEWSHNGIISHWRRKGRLASV